MVADLTPAEVLLERVEMVDYSTGFKQPADPVWRVIVSGYCADFETETAATNFRNAIARLLTAARAEGAAGSVGIIAVGDTVECVTVDGLGDKRHFGIGDRLVVTRVRDGIISLEGEVGTWDVGYFKRALPPPAGDAQAVGGEG